jgi:hypothetical protein
MGGCSSWVGSVKWIQRCRSIADHDSVIAKRGVFEPHGPRVGIAITRTTAMAPKVVGTCATE